jgi:hypothetical protein
MGRNRWRKYEQRRRNWQRHDRDEDDSGAPREHSRGDDLWKGATSGGMLGALAFWFAIWAFTGFNEGLFAIFVGIAILQGWSWNSAEGFHKRRRDRRDRVIGAEQPDQVAQEPVPTKPETAAELSVPARLIAESRQQRDTLRTAASAADGALGVSLRRMDAATNRVVEGLQKDPTVLAHVQRLFTYYLPSGVQLLTARGSVVGTGNDSHVAEIDGMFARLADAFEDFVARMNGTDVRALEIDLKLLEQSLDAEFDPVRKG